MFSTAEALSLGREFCKDRCTLERPSAPGLTAGYVLVASDVPCCVQDPRPSYVASVGLSAPGFVPNVTPVVYFLPGAPGNQVDTHWRITTTSGRRLLVQGRRRATSQPLPAVTATEAT